MRGITDRTPSLETMIFLIQHLSAGVELDRRRISLFKLAECREESVGRAYAKTGTLAMVWSFNA
jgi:hypothetical protein